MPDGKWIIDQSVVRLSADDGRKIITPSSDDIYQAEFRGKTEIQGYSVTAPSKTLQTLKFSKYPVDLEIWIIENKRQDRQIGDYSCYIAGRKADKDILLLSPPDCIPDHCIIDGVWYPFARGALGEISRIFQECNIKTIGKISLKQYFSLIQKRSETIPIRINPGTSLSFPSSESESSEKDEIIAGFRGTLYPYQMTGYRWLRMIDREDLGCILADEMGLGKTIQIICLILANKSEGKKPSLIIAPATLLENWYRELYRFAPGLSVIIHRGPGRTGFYEDLNQYDVTVTSYDTVIRDITILRMIKWNIVVLDEAQAVKNPDALRTKKTKSIPRRLSIAVTGTPVENHLTDLWSICDFVLPGFLGSREEFEKKFNETTKSASELGPLISPIILRRKVSEVAQDLPEKIEIPQFLELPPDLKTEYEKIRRSIISEYGPAAGLVSLIKLRMFCCHPFLISPKNENPAIISPKYQRLIEILEEIISNDEKVLIFTSFSEMINLMVRRIPEHFPGISISCIDGRIPVEDRQIIVDNFNSHSGAAVLVLNPRAAGTGLNLTGANRVIHYNPEWNPAMEDQATARAYRRGQERPVTIHRLIYEGTVEEIINERLDRKRDLFREAVVGTTGEPDEFQDIARALRITPFRGNTDD